MKAYKQIGYEACGGLKNEKQTANAILDSENYFEVYRKDLCGTVRAVLIDTGLGIGNIKSVVDNHSFRAVPSEI